VAPLQGFQSVFPTQRNRELFLPNRESLRKNKEFYRPESKSSPDEIFDKKQCRLMSALTPKANIRGSDRNVRLGAPRQQAGLTELFASNNFK
jgi:hypothetical protein